MILERLKLFWKDHTGMSSLQYIQFIESAHFNLCLKESFIQEGKISVEPLLMAMNRRFFLSERAIDCDFCLSLLLSNMHHVRPSSVEALFMVMNSMFVLIERAIDSFEFQSAFNLAEDDYMEEDIHEIIKRKKTY